ncbi:MAG: site-2 protease family protein [Alphaproteobacteria bacterium]|nr:site-2 protease family protein [Alphaproteobacteria bacterium]
MSERPLTPEEERRLRNLQAVARKLQQEGAEAPPQDTAGADATGALKRWGPIGAAVVFLVGKGKWALGMLKFAKLGSLASMLLSVALYAQVFGWTFAVGFVGLIFVHEMGHAVAMKQQGIPASAPVFIPFVGAVIAMRGLPRDAFVEAVVGIGGPLLGTAGAAACLGVALATGSPFWYALAATGFLINLFNMLPISPLDGGRVLGVVSRRVWIVGYAIGIPFFLVTRSPIVFLVLLMGLFNIPKLRKGHPAGYDAVPTVKRVGMALAYAALLGVMVLGQYVAELGTGSLATEQTAAVWGAAALLALGQLLPERLLPERLLSARA